MAQVAAHRRPHYPPTERMAILELRAARGWNQVQTAKAMLVTPATVAALNRRVDEQGPHALVQLPEPVNRFPDFIRLIVRCLKTLCPGMGKVRIASRGMPRPPARGGTRRFAAGAPTNVPAAPRPPASTKNLLYPTDFP